MFKSQLGRGRSRRSLPGHLALCAGRTPGVTGRVVAGLAALEPLEQRVHLAVVLWDGGPSGDGTNFNDPVNWENDTPPWAASDDAVIPVEFAGITITIDGGAPSTIGSLTSYADIVQINSGALMLVGSMPSVIHGDYQLAAEASIQNLNNSLTFNANFFYRGSIAGSGGTVILGPSSATDMADVVVRQPTSNFGAITLLGYLQLDDQDGVPAVFTNEAGGFISQDIEADLFGTSGDETFINHGEYAVNHGGTTIIGLLGTFVNGPAGTIDLNDGDVSFDGGLDLNDLSGTIEIGAGSTFLITEDSYFTDGLSVMGLGTLELTNSETHTLFGTVTWSVENILLQNGSIEGDGDLDIDSPNVNWESGFAMGGLGTTTLSATTYVYFQGGSIGRGFSVEGYIDGFDTIIVNAGVFVLELGGSIGLNNGTGISVGGGDFVAHGLINSSGESTIEVFSPGSFTLGATGELGVDIGFVLAGNGEFTLLGTMFTNDGSDTLTIDAATTVSVGAGALIGGPGRLHTNAGASITFAAGTYGLTGGANLGSGSIVTINSAVTFGSEVELNGATLTGDGDFVFAGGLTSNGGMLSGAGTATIPALTTFSIANGVLLARQLESFGVIDWTGGGINFSNNATFFNRPGAVFNDNASMGITGSSGTVETFVNEGALNKNVTGTTGFSGFFDSVINAATGIININAGVLRIGFFSNPTNSNAGIIDIDAGGSFRVDSALVFEAGSSLEGLGTLIVGDEQDAAFPLGTFNLAGSVDIRVDATLTINDNAVFSSLVEMEGGSSILGDGDLTFNGGLLVSSNAGPAAWATIGGTGAATVPLGQVASLAGTTIARDVEVFGEILIPNLAADNPVAVRLAGGSVLAIRTSGTLSWEGDYDVELESSASFLNEGTATKTSAAAVALLGAGEFDNAATGIVEIMGGSLTLRLGSNAGSVDIDLGATLVLSTDFEHLDGSLIAGAGSLSLGNATQTISGATEWSAAVAFSQGTITGPGSLIIDADFTWTGGTLSGTGATDIAAGRIINLTTAGTRTLNRPMTVAGTLNMTSATLGGTGTLTIDGILNWTSGEFRDTGQTIVSALGHVNIQTAANHRSSRVFTVNGSASWTAGNLEAFEQADNVFGVISLLGTTSINVASGTTVFNAISGGFIEPTQIVLGGVVTKSGAGTLSLTRVNTQSLITMSGQIDVAAGVLSCTNTTLWTATVTLAPGTTYNALGGTHSAPGSISGDGSVVTAGGTIFDCVVTVGSIALSQGMVFFNSGPHTFGTLTFNDIGSLGGSGNVTVTGSIVDASGFNVNLAGSGQLVLAAGATGTISGAGQWSVSRVFRVDGVLNHTGGNLVVGTGGSLINNGTINIDFGASNSLLQNFSGTSITNNGIINKLGTGTLAFAGATGTVVNSGTINVQAGVFDWILGTGAGNNGSVTIAAGATFRHTGLAVSIIYGTSASISGAGTLAVNIPSGATNVTFQGTISVGSISVGGSGSPSAGAVFNTTGDAECVNLTLSSAILTGFSSVRVSGVFNWTGGTLTGAGQLELAPTGSWSIAAARTTDRPIWNEGTLAINAGGTLDYRAATLTNLGIITLAGGGIIRRDLAGTSTLLNTGTIQSGVGGGTLAASTGTLALDNQGTVLVSADQSLTVSELTNFAAGTVNAGLWDVGGTLTLPTGTIITTIGAGASVRLSGPAAAINASGGGSALATLATNDGELTLHDGAPFAFAPAGDAFANNGAFNVTGTGTVTIPSHITFDNGANLAAGGTITVAENLRGPGPTIVFGPLEGGGTINISGTVEFNQDFEIFAIVNLFIPGTLTGTGNILVSGTFNWFGGAQRGTGSTSVGSGNTLNMFGDGVMTLAREMNNLVAGNWTGGCLLLEGGQFANSMGATFSISGTVEVLSAGEGGESFTNAGALAITSGSDVTFGTDLAVSNTGVVVIESLTVFEEDTVFDGTIELAAGGELGGPGNLTFLTGFIWTGGTMSGTGITTIDASALLLLGDGNMTLSRTLENFSVAGSWTGGCLLMAGGIFNNNPGASLDIFADPRIDVLGISGVNEFNNHGLITVHTGEFVIGVPGTNSGTIIVIPPDTLIFMAPWIYLPGSSLEGPGGVVFGGGMHSFPDGAFGITGPIGIDAGGTLVLPAASMPNYNAATNTFSGGSWTIGAGAQLFLNGADIRTIGLDTTFTLMGDGQLAALANLSRIDGALHLEDGATLAVNPNGMGDTLINNGHLRIGPGSTLDIAGSYQQASLATLHIGIAGAGNAQMGRMLVSGSAALGGSFELTYENGFAASRGNEFRVISSVGTTGEFSSSITPPPPDSSLKAPVLVDALGVRLIVTHIADWDNDLTVSVPDIFGFLTAWFAGDEDAQQFGGTPGVPAIFAFLTAWFAA